MRRLRIFLALFLKEGLRVRYNLGLQLTLVLFVGLTAIITYSAGLTGEVPIVYITEGADRPFVRELRRFEGALRFRRGGAPAISRDPVIELSVPSDPRFKDGQAITLRYRTGEEAVARTVLAVLRQHLVRYLGIELPSPILVLDQTGRALADPDAPVRSDADTTSVQSRKELSMVMLSTLAITIVSFNLFTIMFSEEKSSKALLSQLLSPAGPLLILASKFLFYLLLTQLLVGAVAMIYAPHAAATPAFWIVTTLGSITYMSLASIVVAVTERQSTASLLTLGYLFILGIVVLLSRELFVFAVIREHVPETYLFNFIARAYAGDEIALGEARLVRFATMTAGLFALSGIIFSRRAA